MATVHVLINCKPGFQGDVISELVKFDSMQEARAVHGAFDVVAKLASPNLQEIKDNVIYDIRKIKNIISTVTLTDSDAFS